LDYLILLRCAMTIYEPSRNVIITLAFYIF